MRLRRTAIIWCLLTAGCSLHKPFCDRACVSDRVERRTGHYLGPPGSPGGLTVPEGLASHPLTEEGAVLLALWGNPAFQELLVELDITYADLVQAGLLPNPEFVYFWPEHNKPFKYLFDFALESVWLLPLRVKVARLDNDRACERLTQAALDLIRDTRQAYADVLLARRRIEVARLAVEHRERIARLAAARFEAGDASRQEVATAEIEAEQTRQLAVRVGYDLPVAEARLRFLLGLKGPFRELTYSPVPLPRAEFDLEKLTAEATATRPDVLATLPAIDAARERLALAKVGWIRVLGLLDATSGRGTGHEFGPAFRVTLPIFNCNQGQVARAEAELERAQRNNATVVNQVTLDVRQAYLRYRQARSELDFLLKKVRPEVDAAVRRAERAYREGHAGYIIVLETTRQLIDTYDREAVLEADLRRTWADLERSVGRKLPAPVEAPGSAAPLPLPGPLKEEPPAELPPPRKDGPKP